MLTRILAAAALAAAACAVAAPPAAAADAVSLRFNWYLGGLHVPYYLGKENGYFKAEGIDITLNEGRGSANTVQVVAAGSDTFGMADAGSLMLLASKGADVKAVMSLLNTSGFSVISLAETGIKTPKDLEGKKLAVTAGDALTQLFPAFVKHNKLDMAKISLVQVDPAGKVVSVLEKKADALLGGIDDQYFLIEAKGAKPAGLRFADNGANTVGMTILAKDETIKAKPDMVRRFVKASIRSWEAAKKDPDAAVAAALKTKPDLNKESTKKQLVMDISLLPSPATKGKPIGWGAASDWEATKKLLAEYRDLKTDKPATAFFTNDFVPK
ncbi:MAG: ABC transporter substrate-binding protein [Alphaproteobacteria bacterium]|nr:ABC transporter substrate-binding protein [Alphaproteobacteria bacterium]